MSLALRLLAAAASGALATGAACPPVSLPWLQWVALVPLLRALDGLAPRRAALVGLAWSLGANLSLFTWLGVAAARFGDLPWPVAALLLLLYALLESGGGVLLGALDGAARRRRPGARRLLFPLAFVASERMWPQLFHWTTGAAQAPVAPVAQLAALGGPLVISFVVAATNAGLDGLLDALRGPAAGRRRAWRDAALGGGVLLLALLHGAAALAQPGGGEAVRLALVQPGQATTRDRKLDPDAMLGRLLELGDQVARSGAALAVFPESAAPRPLVEVAPVAPDAPAPSPGVVRALEAEGTRAEAELGRLARRCRVPILIGGLVLRAVPGATVQTSPIVARRNVLLAFDPEGRLVDRYDKHLLLPLGEYLPGEGAAPWLRGLLPFAGRFQAGPGVRTLEGAGLRYAPLICYEAVPGGPPREAVHQGAELLVNATNDVWFEGTQGPHLHAMLVRLRAVETRRPLVRVTSTGLTFVALPDGRLVGETPPGVPAVTVVDVPRGTGSTLFLRLGDALVWLAMAGLALALLTPSSAGSPGPR